MEVIRTELKKVSVGWPSFGILSQFQLYIHLYSVSGTESLLQSNALKKLQVKNPVEHNDSHSVWKVTMSRLSPVWHLLSFGIIPDPIAFSPS